LRRRFAGGFELLDAAPGLVAYSRGDHLVAVNAGREAAELPRPGTVAVAAGAALTGTVSELPAHAGVVLEPA
jgi:hypothetical protein